MVNEDERVLGAAPQLSAEEVKKLLGAEDLLEGLSRWVKDEPKNQQRRRRGELWGLATVQREGGALRAPPSPEVTGSCP